MDKALWLLLTWGITDICAGGRVPPCREVCFGTQESVVAGGPSVPHPRTTVCWMERAPVCAMGAVVWLLVGTSVVVQGSQPDHPCPAALQPQKHFRVVCTLPTFYKQWQVAKNAAG